ncbi:MAG: Gfo/Idh/MocA family oxidoreductase, partial [Planctomycetia bacterium]|nr:Gfo/Idh/MocA family oxidoreductase [Planctomycetia bacterium]
MKKVRLGFVGAGRMGQLAHIACYDQIEDCELVALAEGRTKTAELVARRYGIGEVYPDHRRMLAEADLDA